MIYIYKKFTGHDTVSTPYGPVSGKVKGGWLIVSTRNTQLVGWLKQRGGFKHAPWNIIEGLHRDALGKPEVKAPPVKKTVKPKSLPKKVAPQKKVVKSSTAKKKTTAKKVSAPKKVVKKPKSKSK